MEIIRRLAFMVRRWRERRNPAILVRRLRTEGLIDDEMMHHAGLSHRIGEWPARSRVKQKG